MERLAVLCPPHLAEQWQGELRDKFHINAELVLPSTVTRLERNCHLGQSLFDQYPHVIVSTDFIKSDRRLDEFLRTCPELVIVDEVHTCAYAGEGRSGRHQRHQLVSELAADKDRHLILVTATPHSGKEEAFRSLLRFLDPDFVNLPEDLTGKENEPHRRRLAAYFVQRRRGDILHYLDTDTPFPEREDAEQTYKLSEAYKQFFDRVLRYARETVRDRGQEAGSRGSGVRSLESRVETSDSGLKDSRLQIPGYQHRQRVRWWSALALLRSLASSPAAAAATLRNRAATADTQTPEEADEVSRRTVLDLIDDESTEGMDLTPGSDTGEETDEDQKNRRRLLEMAREADALKGSKDAKLQRALELVKSFIEEGFQPILFCRFIPTAEYVADALRERLPRDVEVVAVTGTLPPAEWENRVLQLAQSPRRVLVCTDCLSEGINLQEHFNAVLHYDLSWNPTRHEQREGRVDRYGQPSKKVRVLTYYGVDNQIDGIVLDVLIRKHKAIRRRLGYSVPVPTDPELVIEAVVEGFLLREQSGHAGDQLLLFKEYLEPKKEELHTQWDAASEREKRSRTMFAQETIKMDEVGRELKAVRSAIGSGVDVAAFTREAFQTHKAVVTGMVRYASHSPTKETVQFDLTEVPRALREVVGIQDKFTARFELPVQEGQLYLNRTHPIVEALATYVMDTALDPLGNSVARRCGVIKTSQVKRRTTLLLVRFRYHIVTRRGNEEQPLLAEDCQVLAFEGSPQSAQWLDSKEAETLLHAKPEANIYPDQASHFLRRIIDDFDPLRPHLDEVARQRGEELLDAYPRVRTSARMKGVSPRVEPQLPPDVLGLYIYLPVG